MEAALPLIVAVLHRACTVTASTHLVMFLARLCWNRCAVTAILSAESPKNSRRCQACVDYTLLAYCMEINMLLNNITRGSDAGG